MKKNNQLSLATGVLGIAALSLAPLTTAGAGDGIATGTVSSTNGSPGQIASFSAMSTFCGGGAGTNGLGAIDSSSSLACELTLGTPANFLQMQQLSSQAAIQSETLSITSPYQFIRSVNQQAQKLRDCQSSDKQQDGAKNRRTECNDTSGGGSSADAYGFIGPFGVSISGGGGFGDRDSAVGQTGFKIDTRQANLIIDYPFTRGLIGGFAFNYVSADRTLGLDSGTLNSDSYRFAPFLSYMPTPNSYITAMGGYARVDFDSTRKVSPFTGSFGSHTLTDANASYGANEFFASLGAGYTWRMDAWSLRGYGRGDYNHLSIGSFQESGGVDSLDGISYANNVNGQSILSATSTLGAELSYAFSTNTLAAVVIPRLHAEWVHEFKNSGRQSQTTYNATDIIGPVSPQLQSIAVAGTERNWANLGFGLQMLFPHAIVGYLNYDTLFIENASNQTVSGGIRVNF
jgi:hypothetical protein